MSTDVCGFGEVWHLEDKWQDLEQIKPHATLSAVDALINAPSLLDSNGHTSPQTSHDVDLPISNTCTLDTFQNTFLRDAHKQDVCSSWIESLMHTPTMCAQPAVCTSAGDFLLESPVKLQATAADKLAEPTAEQTGALSGNMVPQTDNTETCQRLEDLTPNRSSSTDNTTLLPVTNDKGFDKYEHSNHGNPQKHTSITETHIEIFATRHLENALRDDAALSGIEYDDLCTWHIGSCRLLLTLQTLPTRNDSEQWKRFIRSLKSAVLNFTPPELPKSVVPKPIDLHMRQLTFMQTKFSNCMFAKAGVLRCTNVKLRFSQQAQSLSQKVGGLFNVVQVRENERLHDVKLRILNRSGLHIYAGSSVINCTFCRETQTKQGNVLCHTLDIGLNDQIDKVVDFDRISATDDPYILVDALAPSGQQFVEPTEDDFRQHRAVRKRRKLAENAASAKRTRAAKNAHDLIIYFKALLQQEVLCALTNHSGNKPQCQPYLSVTNGIINTNAVK